MASHGIDGRPEALIVPVTRKLTENLDPFFLMKPTPYVIKYLLCRESDFGNYFFFQLTSPIYPEGKNNTCGENVSDQL
jgi:hypothetical protein